MDYIVPLALMAFSSAAALFSLESKSLVYGAIALAVFFLGLSLFFFYLDLPYLAIFQLAVYVGAIVVLIMFTVMIVGDKQTREGRAPLVVLGALGFVSMITSFAYAMEYFGSLDLVPSAQPFSMASLSAAIVQNYGAVILVLACLLTASAYGAIALARKEAEET
ncbi:MAG: NADH-quinone oxidoreductase subunit J [Nitrososphaerota archaeon]|nr:NADH-quinone oxidoreductase subunit J [Nitrososphaerota archaeon]